MGLFQKAVETYDYMSEIVGKEIEDKATLAPIGFITTKVQICITLKQNGTFASADRIFTQRTLSNGKIAKDDKTIIIPVTEKSSGRTSSSAKITPHPLCDKYLFFNSNNSASYEAYIAQLEEWCNSDFGVPEIQAVLTYVKSGTINADLSHLGEIKNDDFICWKVFLPKSTDCEELWKNQSVISSYIHFCTQKAKKNSRTALCYVTGNVLPKAQQHLKGIVAAAGNAKLISANDSSNFTYRGRLLSDEEASSVSFIASQKAHNLLKWLVANDGIRIGDRTLICWNPKGKSLPKLTRSLFDWDNDENEKPTPTNYREVLSSKIAGYSSKFELDDQTVIAIFEAATTGRLSMSYYSEMRAEDFFNRIKRWDESTAWIHYSFGVFSPNLKSIVCCAFGTLRTSENQQTVEIDEKVESTAMQRLLLCRLGQSKFPLDIMRAAVQKCSSLALYDEGKNRQNQLFTTCAIIRKYYFDHFKEDWSMALEPEKKNRSYQYGRLLAIMEKAERDTYDQGEKRETNAIRMQQLFVKRPAHVTTIIMEQLKNAYFPRLTVGTRNYYEKMIGEIFNQISECENWEIEKPLTEEYLMGYYLQKNALYTKKNNDTETEDN